MYNELYITKRFNQLEKHFGVEFEDKELLVRAFIHPSYHTSGIGHYERLEFLGDSVVQIVISDFIYRSYPDMSEGDMSRLRATVVTENAFAYLVRKNTMIDYILLGKSITNDLSELSNSYVADVFESFVAAIYLDQGFRAAEKFIYDYHIKYIDEILLQDFATDFKTNLQELLQVNGPINLEYRCTPVNGGFNCELFFDEILIGQGTGKSKKVAEHQAAKYALSVMVNNESTK